MSLILFSKDLESILNDEVLKNILSANYIMCTLIVVYIDERYRTETVSG